MTTEGLQPADLEELAAYIDGSLPEPRRQAVERRLVTEPRYYEIFLDTVRFQQEERGDGPLAHGPPRKGPGSFWWGVAATAAAALGGLLLLRAGEAPSAVELSRRLDAAAVERLRADWPAPPWEVFRSGPDLTGLGEEQIAFRLGVLTADLAVAVRGGDDRRAQEMLVQSSALVDTGPLDFLAPIFRELLDTDEPAGGRIAAGPIDAGPVEDAVTAALEEAVEIPELLPAFRLGGWAEIGRLACLAGDSELLASQDFRQLPVDLEGLPPEARQRLDAILADLQERPFENGEADDALVRLRSEFSELLSLLSGQSHGAAPF